jgi:transcriptional regulator with XRE-family HTH domain
MPDRSPSSLALSKAVRQIRLREGMTQEDLAGKAGVHLTWISRLESGRRDPRWSSLCRIAAGLGIPVFEIVALAERLELD